MPHLPAQASDALEPIHAELPPVLRYAQFLTEEGKPRAVVTIPAGTAAHRLGYRFVSIDRDEVPDYTSRGAVKLWPVR